MTNINNEKIGTKEKIINQSIELFRGHSYSSVTVNDICKACDITKSCFYYHYKSKDDILSDYYLERDFMSIVLNSNISDLLTSNSIWDQIWKLYSIILNHITSSGVNVLSQFYIVKLNKDPDYFKFNPEYLEVFVPLIQKAQESGMIQNQKPAEELCVNSLHFGIGLLLDWCIKKGDYDPEPVFKKAFESFFDVKI